MQDPEDDQIVPPFQARGLAWSPDRADIYQLLGRGEHADIQPIYYGSNHCFLLTLRDRDAGESLAVYKPARGEYPLYDFPTGSLYRREVASQKLDTLLGWSLIPPAVVGDGQFGPGSLQLFIESRSEGEVSAQDLLRIAVLDIILNNADRKPEHLLIGDGDRVWAIDHGLTFHPLPKLRTILWHFAGMDLPDDVCMDVRRLANELQQPTRPETREIRRLLSQIDWSALVERVNRLMRSGRMPDPRYKPVPYRW